jgi:hypothetical protein
MLARLDVGALDVRTPNVGGGIDDGRGKWAGRTKSSIKLKPASLVKRPKNAALYPFYRD